MDNDGKYYLFIGCHRGTLMSRDSDNPRPFDTYEAYHQEIKKTQFEVFENNFTLEVM